MSKITRPSAKMTVTTGPDRGKIHELNEELITIGAAEHHEWRLMDPTVAEREVRIVYRNGRHAIFVVESADVEVDKTIIPADRWVWLPDTSMIRLTPRTSIEFVSLLEPNSIEQEPASSDGDDKGAPSKGPSVRSMPSPIKVAPIDDASPKDVAEEDESVPAARGRKGIAKKGDKGSNVAKFITDQHGDPLVKLGEDGHLPELQLQEGEAKNQRETRKKESNPLLLIAAFCLSVGLSMLLLFVDIDTTASTAAQKAEARKLIALFHGGTPPLEPYEIKLRQAQQAYSQGNYSVERQRYRDVLAMLRAEDKHDVKGLTRLSKGSQDDLERLPVSELKLLGDNFWQLSNDEKLSRLIAILLSGG